MNLDAQKNLNGTHQPARFSWILKPQQRPSRSGLFDGGRLLV